MDLRTLCINAKISEAAFLTPPSIFEFIVDLLLPICKPSSEAAAEHSDDEENVVRQSSVPPYVLEMGSTTGILTAILLGWGCLPLHFPSQGSKVDISFLVQILEKTVPEDIIMQHLQGWLGDVAQPQKSKLQQLTGS